MQKDIFDRWYARYTLAFLLLWASEYLIRYKPDYWLIAILFAIPTAIYFARELAIFLVLIYLLVLLFNKKTHLLIGLTITFMLGGAVSILSLWWDCNKKEIIINTYRKIRNILRGI